jgi:hypothetical protein
VAVRLVILTGGTEWIAPADWTDNNTIHCIAGGGAGGWGWGGAGGAQGGGGGAYSRTDKLTGVSPGQPLYISVGGGGTAVGAYGATGNPGGATWVSKVAGAPADRNQGCLARPGTGGTYGSQTDNRGNADTSIGDVRYWGGIGGSNGNQGGGGGGAAGPYGAGGPGGNASVSNWGGGGGGNGGGAGGGSPPGGNNYLGYGGATSMDVNLCFGVDGGGGRGGQNEMRQGQNLRGGNGIEWGSPYGSGGGGGGGFANYGPINTGGAGGLYGAGGGGGAAYGSSGPAAGAGDGAQGLIAIEWDAAPINNFWVKNGGAWAKSSNIWVKNGGAWAKSTGIWVKSGGTWRKA